MSRIFVTGATGFLGRHLVGRLAAMGATVVALGRRPGDVAAASVQAIRADLMDAAAWRDAIDGADTVIHLAAAVGKASRSEFFRINHEGTELLLGEAKSAGVRRFILCSSIAAGYTDTAHYHYAHSKQAAEQAVRDSGIASLIVRPTIILGPGSAIGSRFRALAAAPILPIFGDGRTRIQPVHVDDVAAVITARLRHDAFDGRTIDVGGLDIVTMQHLLSRLHRAIRGRDPRVLHLPVHAMRSVLGALERVSPALAPVTAGQLAAFCNDGVATDDVRSLAPDHTFVTLDEMIAGLAANA